MPIVGMNLVGFQNGVSDNPNLVPMIDIAMVLVPTDTNTERNYEKDNHQYIISIITFLASKHLAFDLPCPCMSNSICGKQFLLSSIISIHLNINKISISKVKFNLNIPFFTHQL
jgi:hypothetical protein